VAGVLGCGRARPNEVALAFRQPADDQFVAVLEGPQDKLVGQRVVERDGDPVTRVQVVSGPDVITVPLKETARRKQALAALFSGRTPQPQPRDAGGRYASSTGARTPAPSPESHGDWLGRVVRSRVADVAVASKPPPS
jgi:hypothetical protein